MILIMKNVFKALPYLDYAFHNPNYKIINISKKKTCYVFLSGNKVNMFKLTKEYVDSSLDVYEWQNISKNKKIIKSAGKIIFIKDLASKFYQFGINHEINSIPKIIDFVKRETQGYQVMLIGYSSGAYLSAILSMNLTNVKRAIGCGVIFNILSWRGVKFDYTKEDISILASFDKKYTNIISQVEDKPPNIVYIYGSHSQADLEQYNQIKHIERLNKIGLDSERHCGHLSGMLLVELLTTSDSRFHKIIDKYTNKNNIPENTIYKRYFFFAYYWNKVKRFIRRVINRLSKNN